MGRRPKLPPVPDGLPPCPHPQKRRFVERANAKRFIKRAKLRGADLEAYRCQCGFWHLATTRPMRPSDFTPDTAPQRQG